MSPIIPATFATYFCSKSSAITTPIHIRFQFLVVRLVIRLQRFETSARSGSKFPKLLRQAADEDSTKSDPARDLVQPGPALNLVSAAQSRVCGCIDTPGSLERFQKTGHTLVLSATPAFVLDKIKLDGKLA